MKYLLCFVVVVLSLGGCSEKYLEYKSLLKVKPEKIIQDKGK